MLGQALGGLAGRSARRTLSVVPPLRMVDSAGGVVLGAAMGLAVCWTVGAVLLYLPGQTELRHLAQESKVVSALTDALPPQRVMDAVGGIDPFSAIVGPAAGVDAPDPAIARDPQIRAARQSVVRVRGFAGGLGIEGSGWIVRAGYVVTNAHVVAGVESPYVDRGDITATRPSQRKTAVILFTLFCILGLVLTFVGIFFRGPGYTFVIPFVTAPGMYFSL